MKKCVYCGKSSGVVFSREHVISNCVLKEVFGEDKRNITKVFGKTLIDHEQLIKDVCKTCNSNLTQYDIAGKELIKIIKQYYDATKVDIPCDLNTLNWIIKTHLNSLRMLPDKETKNKYLISEEIYTKIKNNEFPSKKLCRLFIEGWKGEEYFWNETDERRIPYFDYHSIRARNQKIIISNLRIKFVNTFLFIPYLNDYTDFEKRLESLLIELKEQYNCKLQEVDFEDLQCPIKIHEVLTSNDIKRFIRRE